MDYFRQKKWYCTERMDGKRGKGYKMDVGKQI
jgi:hypothetical protein